MSYEKKPIALQDNPMFNNIAKHNAVGKAK